MIDTTTRNADRGHMLRERRREIQEEVHRRIRDGRTDRSTEVGDDLEHSDAGIQADLEVALLQMRAETLARIDEALARLEAGQYETCIECAREISQQRLRALPFAVRCQACEERREQAHRRARQRADRNAGLSLFRETVGV